MKYFFISVVSFLMIIFIYWTAFYFLSGYNLTDNQAHLDLSSMLKSLNSSKYLDIYYFDDLIKSFDNLRVDSIDFISNKLDFSKASGFKFLLNSFNYVVKFYNFVITPIISSLKVIYSLFDILIKVINFIIAMLIFVFRPVFI